MIPPVDTMDCTFEQRAPGAVVIELTDIVPSRDLEGKAVVVKTDVPEHPEITVPIKLVEVRSGSTGPQPARVHDNRSVLE